MKHIAMLSGGRDSTAMVFYMLKNNIHIDYVIFTDTGSEFPEMYKYLDKVEKKLDSMFGVKLTRLKHKKGHTFNDWVFGKITSGKREGMTRGLPMVTQPCFWKRESKVNTFVKFLKDNNITEHTQYIGYTYTELKRSNVKNENQKFPLIEAKKCESDVDLILKELNLVNPLYDNFERTGCYFCPYQKLRGFYLLWKLHPDRWNHMKSMEGILDDMNDVINPQWNIRYTMMEMEESFASGKMLFEVEAPKACSCEVAQIDLFEVKKGESNVLSNNPRKF